MSYSRWEKKWVKKQSNDNEPSKLWSHDAEKSRSDVYVGPTCGLGIKVGTWLNPAGDGDGAEHTLNGHESTEQICCTIRRPCV